DQIRGRAEKLIQSLGGAPAQLVEGRSVIGGGSTPEQALPTWLIAIECEHVTALERVLRAGDPPVVARIEDGRLLLDLRTVFGIGSKSNCPAYRRVEQAESGGEVGRERSARLNILQRIRKHGGRGVEIRMIGDIEALDPQLDQRALRHTESPAKLQIELRKTR